MMQGQKNIKYRLEFKYLGTNLKNQNSIQEEVRECLLSFGAESFVFQFAIKTFKDEDVQKYNVASYFVWVCNLVADIEGGM